MPSLFRLSISHAIRSEGNGIVVVTTLEDRTRDSSGNLEIDCAATNKEF